MEKYKYTLSLERLNRYKDHKNKSIDEIINLYLININLSEAMYPALSLLEVTLRNKIDYALSNFINSDWVFNDKVLYKEELIDINIAKSRIKGKNLILSKSQLIAELNLGFWVSIFKNKYKPVFWNKSGVFEEVFPYFDIKTSNRLGYIQLKLKQIKTIRNRISHHEAIFDYSVGLNNCYKDITTLLNWLAPEINELLSRISKFEEVWEENEKIIRQCR